LSTVRVRLPSALGLVRVVLDADALDALDARRNPLLGGGRGPRARGLETFDASRRFVREVPLGLHVGETSVGAQELAGLEAGDVLLVERPLVRWREGVLEGESVDVRVGAGGLRLSGLAETSGGAGHGIVLRLDALTAEGDTEGGPRRFGMREEEMLADASDDGSGVLENLMLTVHVELAARRITLDELARLRAGQILELGCRPDDPVDLIADGRRIARGELVDVEGRLGVRITQLAG
ncbi:MAG TPA: type III secretion system cytoplasmic ring protein SctQ, partial [Pyrinomonadaceae bacterium]|nr:type III secretion system cytoplasmic ring protein SctQ [Pyrinomonadaceae bacterium]